MKVLVLIILLLWRSNCIGKYFDPRTGSYLRDPAGMASYIIFDLELKLFRCFKKIEDLDAFQAEVDAQWGNSEVVHSKTGEVFRRTLGEDYIRVDILREPPRFYKNQVDANYVRALFGLPCVAE